MFVTYHKALTFLDLSGNSKLGVLGVKHLAFGLNHPACTLKESRGVMLFGRGSCWCALIGVPCRLRMLSTLSTFDNMLTPTISPHAKRAETDPRQGTPTRAHLQPLELLMTLS